MPISKARSSRSWVAWLITASTITHRSRLEACLEMCPLLVRSALGRSVVVSPSHEQNSSSRRKRRTSQSSTITVLGNHYADAGEAEEPGGG